LKTDNKYLNVVFIFISADFDLDTNISFFFLLYFSPFHSRDQELDAD